ncbi:MAG: antitoxin family protein [Fimbriimonadia bacterium]|nr:antitoxin family protein [Fimbriimonadia bacterium]
MSQTIEAIYENGVLRPLEPLSGLGEHARLLITIEPVDLGTHPLESVIGILPDEDAQEMQAIVEREFERVNLDKW